MSHAELLEIHGNNSDLNIINLAAIADISQQEAREVIADLYESKGREFPTWLER